MAKFGEIIRVLRIKRGYSQEKLAKMIGIKRSAIGNYEAGIREPDFNTVELFADFFDVSVDDLIGRNENGEPTEGNNTPKTVEARRVSAGIDRMPPDVRKKMMEYMEMSIFAQYFKNENKED